MDLDLWKTSYECLYGDLNKSEYEFIACFIPPAECDSYHVEEASLNEAIAKAREKDVKIPYKLLRKLREAMEKNKGNLEFRIY